jgi:hypothetical protein
MLMVQEDWQVMGFPSAKIVQLWEYISQPMPMVCVACFQQALGQGIMTEQSGKK